MNGIVISAAAIPKARLLIVPPLDAMKRGICPLEKMKDLSPTNQFGQAFFGQIRQIKWIDRLILDKKFRGLGPIKDFDKSKLFGKEKLISMVRVMEPLLVFYGRSPWLKCSPLPIATMALLLRY